jgi:putative ABC transport system permease protein
LRFAAAGVAIGLAGAAVTARSLAGILFGVRAENPVIFGFSAAILIAAAILASLAPALRASRIDPVDALRRE